MKYIFLHGLGQTSSSWDKVIDNLDFKDDILCPNLSKWTKNKETCYHTLYTELENYCSEIREPICLCGLSLGGILAMQYAIEHSNKVHAVVLIGTQYKIPKLLLKIQNVIFRFMPHSMFSKMGFQKADFIHLCKSMIELDFTNDLKRISCPALILCGEKDKANKEACIQLQKMLSNATLKLISNASHEVNIDNSNILADIIKVFFGNH